MAALPYVTATGNIDKALRAIKSAATPETISQDFVKTILKIRGGSGNQMTSFLKKIGFANADGTPSEIYKRFRNTATTGSAAAQALKFGYAPLYKRNEYMHELSDDKLRGLVIEETGQGDDSSVVSLVLASIKALKKFADWSPADTKAGDKSPAAATSKAAGDTDKQPPIRGTKPTSLNLSYTINLNLPATSDTAVFNAIFKSLKDHLLRTADE